VIASKKAYEVAKNAASLVEFRTKLHSSAEALGLSLSDKSVSWSLVSFDRCADHLRRYADIKALLIVFFGDLHSVTLFRESASNYLFFDANAGSYRVTEVNLRAFLTNYNNVCLPKKWPATAEHAAFNEPATQPFTRLFTVDRFRR
jgi:hypothetical protein